MPFIDAARAARPALRPGRRRDVPAQAAARRDGRAVDAAVAAARRRRRGERAVAAPAAQPAAAAPAAARRRSSRCSPRGRSSSGRPASPATSSWSSTRRRSMAATDVAPNRLDGGQGRGRSTRSRDLPAGGKVSVIAAGPDARGSSSTRRPTSGRVRQALDEHRADVDAAATSATRCELAGKLAARSRRRRDPRRDRRGARDAARPRRSTRRSGPAGRARRARTRRSSRSPSGRRRRRSPGRSSSASPTSTSSAAERRLEVWGDGRLLEARDLFARPAGPLRRRHRRRPAPTSRVVEVRLAAGRPGRPAAAPDQLAVDDRAWAVVPPDRTAPDPPGRRGRPVPRDRALSYLPERRAVRRRRPTSTGRPRSARTDGRATSSSSRASCRRRCRDARSWPSRRRGRAPLGDGRRARSTDPGIGSLDPDEPILRYVDLSTTHIAEAQQARRCPDWARTVIPGPSGAPLLYAGMRAGLPTAVLAFEPRRSDLPLQVAFPILLANLDRRAAGRLGGADRGGRARRAGRPARSRPARPACASRGPTASVDRARAGRGRRRRRVTFAATDLLGVYTVTPIRPRRVAGPGVAPGAERRATPRRVAPARPVPRVARRVGRARSTRTPRSGSRSTCSTSTSRRSRPGVGGGHRGARGSAGRRRAPRRPRAAVAADDRPTDPRRAVGPDRAARPASCCASSGPSTSATRSIRLRRAARRRGSGAAGRTASA